MEILWISTRGNYQISYLQNTRTCGDRVQSDIGERSGHANSLLQLDPSKPRTSASGFSDGLPPVI